MPRTPIVALLVLASAALALLAGGCASGSSRGGAAAVAAGEPIRIRYVVYASRQNLELVNPAHSDPTELYSNTRKLEDAGRKVSTDEVLAETLRYFTKQGFDALAEPGPAPQDGGGAYSQALEVETPRRHVHFLFHRGLGDADRRVFLECAKAFADVYNSTYQLQSVDRAPDWENDAKLRARRAPKVVPLSGGGG